MWITCASIETGTIPSCLQTLAAIPLIVNTAIGRDEAHRQLSLQGGDLHFREPHTVSVHPLLLQHLQVDGLTVGTLLRVMRDSHGVLTACLCAERRAAMAPQSTSWVRSETNTLACERAASHMFSCQIKL